MTDAAGDERRTGTLERTGGSRLFVATWAEALPLFGLSPRVTGMGRRSYDVAGRGALLSAGFAGACQPQLRPGDVLLAGEYAPALAPILRAIVGDIRTVDHVASPAEKEALGRDGAFAVDMETAWLAACAAEAGRAFASLRVIVDRLQDRAVSLSTVRHYPLAALRLRWAVRLALARMDQGLE